MIDFGIVTPGTTLYIPFQTFSSDDPSASMTLTGLATTDIEIYKNGSTTQRSSDSGYALLDTDGIDFDTITGIHGFSVNLSDNTDAGFYAAGAQYWIVVSSVTVDAATINFIAATFRIGYPSAILNTTIATLSSQTSFTLTAGPAEDDALNGMEIVIHDVASAVQMGRAVILDYTGSTKTVTLAAGTTFTAAASDNVAVIGPSPLQPTTSGNKLDVSSGGEAGLDWANVGTPGSTVNLSATTVKTATDVEADTEDIQTRLPAALTADGNIKADTLRVGGTLQTARDIGASVLLSSGTGTGQLDFTSGIVKSDMRKAGGEAVDTVNPVDGNGYLYVNTLNFGATASSIVDDIAARQYIVLGNTASATSSTIVGPSDFSTTDDMYKGCLLLIVSGTGIGQSPRLCTGYTGSTRTFAITPNWTVTPASPDKILVLPYSNVYSEAAAVRTAVGLASANLDTQLDALPTTAELATALAAADDAVLAAIAALNNLSAAQVNAEVVDALATDTYAEPGQGAPSATTSLAAKLNYLYKWMRNKKDNTGTENRFYADNGTTVDQKQTTTESGGTVTVGEMATGA